MVSNIGLGMAMGGFLLILFCDRKTNIAYWTLGFATLITGVVIMGAF